MSEHKQKSSTAIYCAIYKENAIIVMAIPMTRTTKHPFQGQYSPLDLASLSMQSTDLSSPMHMSLATCKPSPSHFQTVVILLQKSLAWINLLTLHCYKLNLAI